MQINSQSNDFKWLETWYIQTVLLVVVVIVSYGHTLDVPFYLDDFSSIQENPVIYNWQRTLGELWQFATLRIVGYLSFALNYQVHQFQVAGYHIVNIIIHLLTGCAVLGLLRGLVRTPALNTVLSENSKRWLPLIVALIFLLHPLQIQGVTYIVQRLASLAALFYVATLASFIQARLAPDWQIRILWILTGLLLALLAFFTKQNTATLPISLLLLELIFFPGHKLRLILATVIALFGLGTVWVILALVFNQNPFSLEAMQALTRETGEISRSSYLATQMSVLWKYISLFVWPASSHIDYDYPITETFLSVNENYHLIANVLHSVAIWALIGHLLWLSLAAYSLRRWPLVSFGIFFYYLAHAIESSLIPIQDVIFEHRTYLPNLGLAVLCGWLLVVQLPRRLAPRYVQVIVVIFLLVLGTATWQRNQMWRDPVALWQHNVEQSPGKKRAWIILGKHFIQRGKTEKEQGQLGKSQASVKQGINALNKAIDRKTNLDGSQSLSITPETALNLVVAHKMLGQYQQALQWVNRALALKDHMRPFDQAKFLVNQGNIFYELGRHNQTQGHNRQASTLYQEAENSYRQALQVYPPNLKARINLASILVMLGRLDEAIALYQEVLAINPSNTYVKDSLQKLQQVRQRGL